MAMTRQFTQCCLVLLAATVANTARAQMNEPIVIPSRPGPVEFSHQSHRGIGCGVCHHTVKDGPIERSCRACHTADSRDPVNSRDAFHSVCIACHLAERKAGRPSGPAKLCSECHLRQ